MAYGHGDIGNQAQAEVPVLRRRLEATYDRADQVRQLATKVLQRLDPVLRPELPKTSGTNPVLQATEVMSDYAQRVAAIGEVLNDIHGILSAIEARSEV
jgi:hypothetical protein